MSASWGPPANHNPQGPNARREIIETALLLLLLLVAFFWPAVFGGRVLLPTDLIFDVDPLWQPLAPEGYTRPANPILSDQVLLYFPWKVFTLRSLAEGQLPLWNPYIDSGLPFVGNAQSAVFSPFSLAGYLFPIYSSYVIASILRLFVAGIFTFLFAREIGLGRPGALLAMVTFTFSGPMVVWLGYPLSLVIVWLPVMLLTIERALTRKSGLYVIASGLAVGAQFLGGHPETCFYVMLAWAAYALYRAISLEGWQPKRLLSQLARIATAATMGVLLAAVQLLPFVETLFQSATLSLKEAQGFSSVFSFIGRLVFEWHNWPTAITALLPQYFGTDLNRSYWFPYSNSVEQNTYAGVLPLMLAIMVTFVTLRRRSSPRRNLVLFFALLAVICVGVALRFPLLNAVNYLPVFNVAANGRLRLVYVFAIAILAGLGLDEIVRGQESECRIALRILILMALSGLFLVAIGYAGFILFKDVVIRSGRAFVEANWGTPYFWRPLEYYYALVNERYELKLAMSRPSNIVMYLPILIALAWFALNRWGQSKRTSTRLWAYAGLGLTVLDTFLVCMPFNPTIAPQYIFPTPGAIQYLQQDHDIYRVSGTGLILQPNTGMVFGLPDIRGYDVAAPRRYTDLIDHIEGHYRSRFHSLFTQVKSPLLDLLNVKYVLTDQELGGKWELAYKDSGSVRVYRNRDVLPRAFVVYQAQIVDSAARSLERTLDSAFDFRKTVVLEETPKGWASPSSPPTMPPTTRIVAYEPNRVQVQVETSANGLLVLTDNYATGWGAWLDGQAAPVYIANHTFRAVVVPAGAHQVEFVYRPWTFQVGAATSLLALAALALGSFVILIKRSGGAGQ